MVVGLGVDLFDVACLEAEFRKADPVFTHQSFTHDEIACCQRQRLPGVRRILLSVARARGVAFASVVLEPSP